MLRSTDPKLGTRDLSVFEEDPVSSTQAEVRSKAPAGAKKREDLVEARHKPIDGSKRTLVQKEERAPQIGDRSALDRLTALVSRPDQKALPRSPPPARKLIERIRNEIGVERAPLLSSLEIATILGEPGWAPAVSKVGGRLAGAARGESPHFLLAAHLSRWMEGMEFHASVDEVARSFIAAHPTIASRFQHLDGAFVSLLQRAYPFMPSWTRKPEETARSIDAADLLAVPASPDELYAERLSRALDQMSEVPLSLPLTERLAARLAERGEGKKPFESQNVVMVQHMLGQAVPFVDAMVTAGLDPSNAEFVGVPYQKNPAVRIALERTYGLDVTVPERGDIDSMWKHVGEAIDRAYERHLKNGDPILVIDDGGYASKYIAQHYAGKEDLFKVVEQTTRGLTEIANLETKPKFPIVNVAGSFGKRFESAQVGDAVVQSVRHVLEAMGTTVARKDILVVGAGKVGQGVAEAFRGDNARVTIYDPYLTYDRRRELERLGFKVITDKKEALDSKFLVVGCSGHRSIDLSDFEKDPDRKTPVFFASSSSKRVEIDVGGLAKLATDEEGKLRRILAARVNEQESWHYWLADGRIVTALADGLPINFQDVNSIAPELIDHTMALMILGAAQAVSEDRSGLVELERSAQFELQAELEGLRQKAAGGDVMIEVGGRSFYGSEEQWLSVASSPATPPEVIEAIYRKFVEHDPMHEVVLACLGKRELTDAMVLYIQQLGYLPHIARVVNNESASIDQIDKLLWFLGNAAVDITDRRFGTSVAMQPIGVRLDPRGVPEYFSLADPRASRLRVDDGVLPGGGLGARETRDIVLNQIAAILFSHPRCPTMFREGLLKDPSRLIWTDPINVHLLHNPEWTTQELDTLFRGSHRDLLNKISEGAIHFKDARDQEGMLAYAFDALDAFAEHPKASTALKKQAAEDKQIIQSRMRWLGRQIRGYDSWPETAFGIRMPTEY
jgi:S-adenosylhomocysteine hydrolase